MTKKQMLVVDDDVVYRDVLKNIFLKEEFEVFDAEDGIQGADLAKARAFSLIVTDLNMPKMNGLDMIKEIRLHDVKVPVILSSGGSDLPDLNGIWNLAPISILEKPFDSFSLLEISKALMAQTERLLKETADLNGSIQRSVDRSKELIKEMQDLRKTLKIPRSS